MDTLYLGAGSGVFAFLGESKLNLIAGIVLLACALWSLVAIIAAFAAAPRRKSVRLALFTVINVAISVVLIAYSAVVALEKAGVIAVSSSAPTDNAFLSAIVNLITLGAEEKVFEYGLYGSAVLAVIALITTLARSKRAQFLSPVAKAKDDGYVVVDDGAEQPSACDETEKTEDEDTVGSGEPEGTEETEIAAEDAEETKNETELREEEEDLVTEREVISEPAAEENKDEDDGEGNDNLSVPADKSDREETDGETTVPISVAEKRIADMGSVLGKLDDLFTLSAAGVTGSAFIGETENKRVDSDLLSEPEKSDRVHEKTVDDPDSIENILDRILGATGKKQKSAPAVKSTESFKADLPREEKKESETSEAEPNFAPASEKVAAASEKTAGNATVAVEEKADAKRARRVRTIGRAAELFDEYLSLQTEEDKKKLTESIDCVVVDKDKK